MLFCFFLPAWLLPTLFPSPVQPLLLSPGPADPHSPSWSAWAAQAVPIGADGCGSTAEAVLVAQPIPCSPAGCSAGSARSSEAMAVTAVTASSASPAQTSLRAPGVPASPRPLCSQLLLPPHPLTCLLEHHHPSREATKPNHQTVQEENGCCHTLPAHLPKKPG